MVQFYTLQFCRTILVGLCGLKKRVTSIVNSIVLLHEAPTKNSNKILANANSSEEPKGVTFWYD